MKHPDDLVYKFLTTLTNAGALYDDIINLRPKNLQEAVGYVESHSKGGAGATTDRSQIRCSFCRGIGHTAKTCRKKNNNRSSVTNNRTKKVNELDAGADDESAGADMHV